MTARITFKSGVRLGNLQPQTVLAIQVAAGCYGVMDIEEMVVTSINDGSHSRGSLHYSGNAVDLRTNSVPTSKVRKLEAHLKMALGADFDVVLESFVENQRQPNEHIHIEHQPKT